MTDHPEFPDQTSESYLAPKYRLDALVKENERLRAERDAARAELARIKPSWNDAPEWAEFAVLEYMQTVFVWQWREYSLGVGGKIKNGKILQWHDLCEERPQ